MLGKNEQMDLSTFCKWTGQNQTATGLIQWVYLPAPQHFTKTLVPTFYESLAKDSNCT